MKTVKTIITTMTLVFGLSAFATSMPRFDHLVVFGDSLSDVGYMNRLPAIGKTHPNLFPDPSKQPTFTTPGGKVWAQYLAQFLFGTNEAQYAITTNNLDPLVTGPMAYAGGNEAGFDYAAGGATTSGVGVSRAPSSYEPPSVVQQLQNYITQHGTYDVHNNLHVDPNSLYVIWDGSDNFLRDFKKYGRHRLLLLFALNYTSDTAPNDLVNVVRTLYSAGAKYIIVMNLPDLGKTPLNVIDKAASKLMTNHAAFFNENLYNGLKPYGVIKNRLEAYHVMYFDTFSNMDGLMANYKNVPIHMYNKTYHYDDVTTPACSILWTKTQGGGAKAVYPDALTCEPSLKGQPTVANHNGVHLFEDMAHPTTYGHWSLARALLSAIEGDYHPYS